MLIVCLIYAKLITYTLTEVSLSRYGLNILLFAIYTVFSMGVKSPSKVRTTSDIVMQRINVVHLKLY